MARRWSTATIFKRSRSIGRSKRFPTRPIGHKYLGPFHSQTVTLSLEKLPPHEWVTMRCKLFMQGTWDGSSPRWGPDLWSLSARGGPRLIFASFCNMGYFFDNNEQSYPDDYPAAIHPAWTGAAEKLPRVTPGKKGTGDKYDAVYKLATVFPHKANELNLDFAGIYEDPQFEQAWGLSDVEVSVAAEAPNQDVEGLANLWSDLGGDDSVKADVALWKFVAAGQPAVRFIEVKVFGDGGSENALLLRRAHRIVRIIGGAETGKLCFRMECLFSPPPVARGRRSDEPTKPGQ